MHQCLFEVVFDFVQLNFFRESGVGVAEVLIEIRPDESFDILLSFHEMDFGLLIFRHQNG